VKTTKLRIAAIQMDATPAPVSMRLERAGNLLESAAKQGAQIAILPEVFNTGYTYTDENYTLAESADGPTLAWMHSTAQRLNLYIAGTMLFYENGDIYNRMFLIAPDRQSWQYDKSYPWGWERAYFRKTRMGVQVADTPLGKFGMLICWDNAHINLWAQYAGQVDMMLVSSCPPLEYETQLRFPDGESVFVKDLGFIWKTLYKGAEGTFGVHLLRQSSWLGVPVVNTTGSGLFQSTLPRPKLSLLLYTLLHPRLWKYIKDADKVLAEAGYFSETYVAAADGTVLRRVTETGDALVVSEVELVEETPRPRQKQPAFGLSRLAYLIDWMGNHMLDGYYRRQVRRFLPKAES
jgi:predicted amidohydrolase